MSTNCKICLVQAELDQDGRCRSCATALAATRAGMTYGKYVAKYGCDPLAIARLSRTELLDADTCAFCGNPMPPRMCIVCGRPLDPNLHKSITICSDACRERRKNDQRRQRYIRAKERKQHE